MDFYNYVIQNKMGESPKCTLCKKTAFLPVTWNNFQQISRCNNKGVYNKCFNSYIYPNCLNCTKEYIHNYCIKNRNASNPLKCPYGCCNGSYDNNNFKYYGEVQRNKSDLLEDNLWITLHSYNVLNYTCNICNKKCDSLKDCIDHNISCNTCKL